MSIVLLVVFSLVQNLCEYPFQLEKCRNMKVMIHCSVIANSIGCDYLFVIILWADSSCMWRRRRYSSHRPIIGCNCGTAEGGYPRASWHGFHVSS